MLDHLHLPYSLAGDWGRGCPLNQYVAVGATVLDRTCLPPLMDMHVNT